MRPMEVLAKHGELRDRLGARTPLGQWVAGFATSQWPTMSSDTELGQRVRNHLDVARSIVVAPNMSEMALRRAEYWMTGLECGVDFWAPYPAGFALFEQPWRFQEAAGRWMLTHALSWGPIRASSTRNGGQIETGMLVVAWNDLRRGRDEISQREDQEILGPNRERTGGWAPNMMEFLHPDMRPGPARVEVSDEVRARNEKLGLTILEGGTINQIRMIMSLWGLMGETITRGEAVEERPVRRQDRRQAARLRLEPAVTVMTLRREADPVLHPGSGSPLEYRVPVEGHTRRYWCGSGAERHVELRTIGSHWRGPKNAPVRVRPKVSRLAR